MIEIIKDDAKIFQVTNGVIGLKFYKKGEIQGKFETYLEGKKSSQCLIKDCFSVINFNHKNTENLYEISSYNYHFNSKTQIIDDIIGKGLRIVFSFEQSRNQEISFEIQFKIYENSDFILIKLINIRDPKQNQLSAHSISPLKIEKSSLYLSGKTIPTNLNNITWFKNGWQSWSPCKVFFGREKDVKGSQIEILNLIYDNQDYKIEGRFYSEYCTVITDLDSNNSLILGFVTLKDQFSRIILDYDNDNELKLLTAFGCMDNVKLHETNIDSSEELFISFKQLNKGYYGLIEYAQIVSLNIKNPRINKIPIGWCSWYYYFTKITQEELIKNLEFFNDHRDFPIDFIQLDDGYFTKIGDFTDINEKFPEGLPWLFTNIKKYGFKGGIWTAPFIAIKRSNLFKNHKNWFLTKADKLLPVLFNWRSFEYSLDLSNEDVLHYLSEYFRNLLNANEKNIKKENEALIEFIKIDFLHAAVPYGADYKNPNLTRAQILYSGVKLIRKAITNDTFLLGCGAPLGPCVGLVDAMRISCDTAPIWDAGPIDKSELSEISLKAALLNTLYRSFMHNHFWINDPDCLMIRRAHTKLNLDEIKLQMTIFGLSGGQILISDDMSKLSKEEIDDAKLLIPPYNPEDYNPIPVDIFISKFPSIYMLETEEVIGKRYLVAIINWENHLTSKIVKISELIPTLTDNNKEFYVFDFWNEILLGKYKKSDIFELKDINPHSCQYLTIIPLTKNSNTSPILLSTNLHITQGCCEIKNFEFDEELNRLLIQIELMGEREGNLILKLPKNKEIIEYKFNYTKINISENIWKILVKFKDKIQVTISFNY